MFLELARFVSLLLSILALVAVLHTAFLEPGSTLRQQLLPALRMLLLACVICVGSGYIFRAWEHRMGRRDASLARSLPMLIFCWGAGLMALLFAIAWLLEPYYLGRY